MLAHHPQFGLRLNGRLTLRSLQQTGDGSLLATLSDSYLSGHDPSYTDPRGRYAYVSAKCSFR